MTEAEDPMEQMKFMGFGEASSFHPNPDYNDRISDAYFALKMSVQLCAHRNTMSSEQVMEVADEFTVWLAKKREELNPKYQYQPDFQKRFVCTECGVEVEYAGVGWIHSRPTVAEHNAVPAEVHGVFKKPNGEVTIDYEEMDKP